MAIRNSASDNSNINPVFSKTSVMKDFGMTGNKPKPKPSPSPTWTRQQLDNWIGDTVAEGDFTSKASRVRAVSDVAKKALATGVVSNSAAARRTAQSLLKKELFNGAKREKGMK
jgi:hypothetical protein